MAAVQPAAQGQQKSSWNQIPRPPVASVRGRNLSISEYLRYLSTRITIGYITWWLVDSIGHRASVRAGHGTVLLGQLSEYLWYVICAVVTILLVDAGWGLASLWLWPSAEVVGLDEQQASLWGVPVSPAKAPVGAPQQPATVHRQTIFSAVSPLRPQRVVSAQPVDLQQNQSFATPPSQSNRTQQRSPYGQSPYATNGSPLITTPEQLERYMDQLEFEMTPQPASDNPSDIPLYLGNFASVAGSPPLDNHSGYTGKEGAADGMRPPQDPRGVGAGLKMGAQAPVYRPTMLPTRAGGRGSGARGTRALTPSSPRQTAAALQHLSTDQRTLEVWTERFREWMTKEVLKPLVVIMDTCHQQVIDAVAEAGQPGMQLQPLDSPPSVTVSSTRLAASQAEGAAVAGQEAVIQQLEAALQTRVSQQPASALAFAALQAVQTYRGAAALLAGKAPAGMLPPAPAAYLATRVRQLAEGTCMKDFTWNSGGEWQGRPWVADLPTDASVLFYLVAAFMETPRWEFGSRKQHTAAGAPLFIATLPSRQPEQFYALLPFRPASLSKGATAVLALQLGSTEPQFTLILGGEPLLTSCSPAAPFTTLLLWLHSANGDTGAVGGRSLEFLRLTSVLKPAQKPRDLLTPRWFGMWF